MALHHQKLPKEGRIFDRDIFRRNTFKLKEGKKYLFYMYVDKTDRLAGTARIDSYLAIAEEGKYKSSDEVTAIVYDTCENGTLNVMVDNKYRGLILANEHFEYIHPGEEIQARVKIIYEDGTLGVTTRKKRLDEREILTEKILKCLKENGGFMPFNDKSSSEDIKKEFNTSKNYFKMTLGGLMKQKLILLLNQYLIFLNSLKLKKECLQHQMIMEQVITIEE